MHEATRLDLAKCADPDEAVDRCAFMLADHGLYGPESLERVAALEPELVLPGHGPPFRGGARRAASIARGKRRRLDRVRQLVEDRDRTVTEITTVLFPRELTWAQRHFAMAEILADRRG